jgi:hypothetical protein
VEISLKRIFFRTSPCHQHYSGACCKYSQSERPAAEKKEETNRLFDHMHTNDMARQTDVTSEIPRLQSASDAEGQDDCEQLQKEKRIHGN